MKQKTVLITGATGFLGSHLLKMLLVNNYNVVIIKRSNSNIYRIKQYIDQINSYDIDTSDFEIAFNEHLIDIVIHTATNYGRNGDTLTKIVESNLLFSLKLLETCIKYKVDTFINTDTMLGKYLNSYSLSKKQFVEWLSQDSNIRCLVNLKLEHMYGPLDDDNKFVGWFISQLKKNISEINLTEGNQLRDFIYIDDVVSAYFCILNNLDKLYSFNELEIGTGKQTSVKDFLSSIVEIYRTQNRSNMTKLNFGSIPYRDGEIMQIDVNIDSLLALGWKPLVDNKEGIKRILDN